jgi:hypothetical protein
VESKWKNYHIITFPGQSLSKTLEEAMDLSRDRLIFELEVNVTLWYSALQLKNEIRKKFHCYLDRFFRIWKRDFISLLSLVWKNKVGL